MPDRDVVRQVIRIPLSEVWDEQGKVVAIEREAHVSEDDIRDLLRAGPVQFVVANVGDRLEWVPDSQTYTFWKAEVRPHLADPSVQSYALEDFPEDYFYLATRWRRKESKPLILLEIHH